MKKAMNQSTMTKLLSGLSILLLGLSAVAFVFITNATNDMTGANSDKIKLTENANRFMSGSAYLTNEVRAYAATGDRAHYDNYWNEINNLKNRDIGVAGMREAGLLPGEEKLIAEMSGLSNNLVPKEEEAMALTEAGKNAEAIDAVYGEEYNDVAGRIKGLQTEFLAMLDTRTNQAVADAAARTATYTFYLLVCLAAAFIMQLVSAFITQRKLIRPMVAIKREMVELAGGNLGNEFNLRPDTSEVGMLVKAIQDTKQTLNKYIGDISSKLTALANGDLTCSMDTEYIGDFAEIRKSMGAIFGSLNKALSDVSSSASEVTSASGQVAAASQSLANASSEQSATIEALSNDVNDIYQSADTNAQTASKTLGDIGQAGVFMDECTSNMLAMVESMDNIQEGSKNISNIIKVIDDIAFQTNILALNAAVEAARAGQYGKGFAVVADEVRSLAAKSAEAAKQTTQMIELSTQSVAAGSQLLKNVETSLKNVADIAEANAAQVGEIDAASREQRDALARVKTAIDEISVVVHGNSATAEETAASSQEMSAQANVLSGIVSAFKLRESSRRPGRQGSRPRPQRRDAISPAEWAEDGAQAELTGSKYM